jgi:hypothetical protein
MPTLYILQITSGPHAGQYVGQTFNWMTPNPPEIGGLLVTVKRLTHDDPKGAMKFGTDSAQRLQAELRERGLETEVVSWDSLQEGAEQRDGIPSGPEGPNE